MKKREVVFVVTALVLGAVIGGLIGDIIGTYLPAGAAKTLFTKSIQIGVDTTRVDFYAFTITLGFTVKINFVSVLTVILVMAYFRWWYL